MNRALAFGVLLFPFLLAAFLWVNAVEPIPEILPQCQGLPREPISVVHVLRDGPLGDAERMQGECALRNMRIRWDVRRAELERIQSQGGLECGTSDLGGFEREIFQPEFRLFVLGYPALAETWARHILKDPSSDGENRYWALSAAIELAWVGYPDGAAYLAECCKSPGFDSGAALLLLRSGLHVRYPELLPSIAAWLSQERRGPGRRSGAEKALEDEWREACALLRSIEMGSWEEQGRKEILGPSDCWDAAAYEQALRVARERRPAWLEPTLRDRMARGHLPGWAPRAPLGDEAYDYALLTLAEIGARLTAPERDYLRFYGYGCEPRARLAEVMQEKGY